MCMCVHACVCLCVSLCTCTYLQIIGWRKGSLRMLLYITNEQFHLAGDGKVGRYILGEHYVQLQCSYCCKFGFYEEEKSQKSSTPKSLALKN